MTLETMAATTALLTERGIKATFEYPGFISVQFERSDGSGQNVTCLIDFGDSAPETIQGDIYDGFDAYANANHSGSIDTGVPSDCTDAGLLADAIQKIVEGE